MDCPYCKAKDIENDAKFCTNCGEDFKYKSIGGWLTLLGIGIWLGPFISGAKILSGYSSLLKDNAWELLTTKGSLYYIEYYAPTLIIELIINFIFISFSFYLIYLFTTKKFKFKKYYTIIAILTPIFILSDAIVVKEIMNTKELFDKESLNDFIKSIIGTCIWVPYIWSSKRSAKTFIN